jgi:hypothetical protein
VQEQRENGGAVARGMNDAKVPYDRKTAYETILAEFSELNVEDVPHRDGFLRWLEPILYHTHPRTGSHDAANNLCNTVAL